MPDADCCELKIWPLSWDCEESTRPQDIEALRRCMMNFWMPVLKLTLSAGRRPRMLQLVQQEYGGSSDDEDGTPDLALRLVEVRSRPSYPDGTCTRTWGVLQHYPG